MNVTFSTEEQQEYGALEKEALDFYTNHKAEHGGQLQRHYLLLRQRLMPMRVACSGGRVPLVDDGNVATDADEDEAMVEETKKKGKKVQQFSEFAFTSKLQTLVNELKQVRQQDPNGMFPASRFHQSIVWILSHCFLFLSTLQP